MTEYVKSDRNGSTLELALDRPDRKNAINIDMYEALTEALLNASSDSTIRSVLLTGSQGCFTSGNDLADFANKAEDISAEDNVIFAFMRELATFPKPVVVAIDGMAVGIGATLLLHCDLAYCSAESNFRLPFVNLGLCPEYASSYLLPRLVGHVKAAEWLLLCEEFSASQARAAGLINAVVKDPLAVAREQCAKLGIQPPEAVRVTKALFKKANSQRVDQAMSDELHQFTRALRGAEFKEAVTAFFEKRQPDFTRFE